MNRLALASSLALAATLTTSAQTNTFPASGNVGIGTTDPQSAVKLDVRQYGADAVGIAAYVYDGTVNSIAIHGRGYATSGNGTSFGVQGLSDYPRGTGTNIGGYFSASGAANNYALITESGNVGIGTAQPLTGLDVRSNGGRITGNHLYFYASGNASDNLPYARLDEYYGMRFNSPDSRWVFSSKPSLLVGYAPDGRYWGDDNLFVLGNVGIGTANPTHKLAVNGTIKAKEIIVETTGWSDYVFADDYAVAPLAEVEAHIKANKHLPGLPSAAQIAEQGVSIGDMQARLLAKIEELTLHQISQEKELAALRAKVARLESLTP